MKSNFNLYRVKISTFDDEYGQWKWYMNDQIIVDTYNHEKYLGSDQIFRAYEKLVEQHNKRVEMYGKMRFEKPRIEIDLVLHIPTEEDLESIKRMTKIDKESEYLKTIYQRVQHYGGSEEGGWYYHTSEATNFKADEVELEVDRYGEGYTQDNEFYFGEHENLERQYYC